MFIVGFVVLLIDGAAAVWLGQLTGRRLLIFVGLGLLAAALGLVVAWRRWQEALDAVDAARADLKQEIARLRAAAAEARSGRDPYA